MGVIGLRGPNIEGGLVREKAEERGIRCRNTATCRLSTDI